MRRFWAAFRQYSWKIIAAPAVVIAFDVLNAVVRWLINQILGTAAIDELQAWAQKYDATAFIAKMIALAETNPVVVSVILAAIVFTYAAIRSEIAVRSHPERFGQQLSPPDESQEPEIPLDEPPSRTEKRKKERIHANVTPQQLMDLYQGRMTAEATALAEPYFGKWVTWTATVHDKEKDVDFFDEISWSVTWIPESDQLAKVTMWFSSDWTDRIAVLQKAEQIIVTGKISDVGLSSVVIRECELMETTVPKPAPLPEQKSQLKQTSNIVAMDTQSDVLIDDPFIPGFYGCRAVIARFHNKPLPDVVIAEADKVTASITYSGRKGEQVHVVRGVWRIGPSNCLTNHVDFGIDSVRELILAMWEKEDALFTVEDLSDDRANASIRRIPLQDSDYEGRIQFTIGGRLDKHEYRFTLLVPLGFAEFDGLDTKRDSGVK